MPKSRLQFLPQSNKQGFLPRGVTRTLCRQTHMCLNLVPRLLSLFGKGDLGTACKSCYSRQLRTTPCYVPPSLCAGNVYDSKGEVQYVLHGAWDKGMTRRRTGKLSVVITVPFSSLHSLTLPSLPP